MKCYFCLKEMRYLRDDEPMPESLAGTPVHREDVQVCDDCGTLDHRPLESWAIGDRVKVLKCLDPKECEWHGNHIGTLVWINPNMTFQIRAENGCEYWAAEITKRIIREP